MSHTLGQKCGTHGLAITGPRRPCPTCPPDRTFTIVSCRPACPEWPKTAGGAA